MDEDTFVTYCSERMLNLTEEIMREKERLVWVFDLSGKIMQLASKKVYGILARVIRNVTDHFPRVLEKYISSY